jgi:hypothetical protein
MKITATYEGGTMDEFFKMADANKDMTIDEFFNKLVDGDIDGKKVSLDQVTIS